MGTRTIILRLLYKSSNYLLRFSFFALPLSLLLSISTYLFIENLLQSYQHYLVRSYIGVQGRISITTSDEHLLNALEKFSEQNHYSFSVKEEFKANIGLILENEKLIKYARFTLLEKGYMKKKFNRDVGDKEIFVNKTFAKSMGSIGLDHIKALENEDTNTTIPIKKIIVIDTGFLGNAPMIFADRKSIGDVLFKTYHLKKSIEFLESDKKHIAHIKNAVEAFAKEFHTFSYTIHDILIDTKETREFFAKIGFIEYSISAFLFLLAFGVIILAIIISIEFKRNSLETLSLLGMSQKDLATTISATVFFMIIAMLVVSCFLIDLYKEVFLSFSNFDKSFFLPLSYDNITFITIGAFLLSVIVYVVVYITFQRR